MSIYQEISKEVVAKYGNGEHGYKMYKKGIAHYTEAAKTAYKTLCEYFNGNVNRTGCGIVPESRCLEVLGYDPESTEGIRVLNMMYTLNITEKSNGCVIV